MLFYLKIMSFVFLVLLTIGFVKTFKLENAKGKAVLLTADLSIVLASISWVTNMGFVRSFLTLFMIPLVHGLVLFVMGVLASPYASINSRILKYNFIFCVTYVFSNLLFPDWSETDIYFFFSLIKNNGICYYSAIASLIFLIIHIIFLVLIIFEISRTNKTENK